ncbi:MAG: flagellar hook-length control protein FliK [Lawsonibacter sp.]|jgi:flagellar hook-length control protein FliK
MNMSMNELVLQMTYAASQAVSASMPEFHRDTQTEETTQDFRSLLEEKRTGQVQGEQETSSGGKPEQTEQAVAPQLPTSPVSVPVAEGQAALLLPNLLSALSAGGQMGADEGGVQPVQLQGGSTLPTVTVPQDLSSKSDVLPNPNMELEQNPTLENPLDSPKAPQQPLLEKTPSGQTPLTVSKENVAAVQAEKPDSDPTGTNLQEVEQTVELSAGAEQALFPDQEFVPQRVGDTPVLDTQSDGFEGKLAGQIQKAVEQGEQRIQLQLTPEHLGRVVVEMSRSPEGVLHVVFHAENEQALKVLSEHSNALSYMLQGGQQSEVRVEVHSSQSDEQPWQQPDQEGGQRQGERQQQEQRRHSQDSEVFLQQLRLGLHEMELV